MKCFMVVCPTLIPKNSIVLVSQYVMHRDPRYFEDPLAFRPKVII
ncbi:cytochrome P450 [Brevibacillus sp. VP]|nr:cytochrome P450 [Brevibacillus sp. VP]